jgi:hypothetical protein
MRIRVFVRANELQKRETGLRDRPSRTSRKALLLQPFSIAARTSLATHSVS